MSEVIESEAEGRLVGAEADPEGFVAWFNSTFPDWRFGQQFCIFGKDTEATGKVAKTAIQKVLDAYEIKIKFEDPNALQSLERYTLLGSIDRLWQEHLYAIDSLRTSINLRTIRAEGPGHQHKRRGVLNVLGPVRWGGSSWRLRRAFFRTSASITAFESFLRNLPQKLIHEQPAPTMSQPDVGLTRTTRCAGTVAG